MGVRQATIQGALGGLPLDLVNAHMSGLPPEEFSSYKKWASAILNTGVLSIVICAPLGLLIIGKHSSFSFHFLNEWTVGMGKAPFGDARLHVMAPCD